MLENLFAYEGRPKHEIVFVFDVRFADASWYARDALPVVETGAEWEPARWRSLDELASGPEPLVPDGLLAMLVAERAHDAAPGPRPPDASA